jgi:Fe-S oxidoreductase
MWMEERIGKRINIERTEEALATGAEAIAIGCPFCRVMLSDGLTQAQADGQGEGVEVLDVAQLLLAGVKRSESGRPDQASTGEPAAATE